MRLEGLVEGVEKIVGRCAGRCLGGFRTVVRRCLECDCNVLGGFAKCWKVLGRCSAALLGGFWRFLEGRRKVVDWLLGEKPLKPS
eukprot:9477573-Pyramimonas_sp.AAC.1